MDPVSIAVATIGTADVTIRLIGFVRKTVEGTKTIDQTLNDVLRLVGRLQSVTSGIRTITCAPDFEQQWRSSFEGAASLTKPWEQLWVDTLGFLEEANQVLQTLDDMLKNIQGSKKRGVDQGSKEEFEAESQPLLQDHAHGKSFRSLRRSAEDKFDRLSMQFRKDAKSEDLKYISMHLDKILQGLDLCLNMINLGWNVKSRQITNTTSEMLSELRETFMNENQKLRELMVLLRPPRSPVPEPEPNPIFQAPAASPLFTGRTVLLSHVEEAFGLSTGLEEHDDRPLSSSNTLVDMPPPSADALSVPMYSWNRPTHGDAFDLERKQKRFVLVGLGGSGKTEFCRKFAERNQSSFWGVFWIDATSDETAQHSYKAVAQLGAVAENIKAAMTWLASQVHRWLLVIDNVDDPEMDVEKYLPGGGRGHVLLTTRRPALRRLGNSGQGFFELEKLEEGEAQELLLKHAQERRPWSEFTISKADRITSVLGYLPLALVYAGQAIADGVTTLADYISWFEESWDRIRGEFRTSGRQVEDTGKNVFAPYEAMLKTLGEDPSRSAQNAIELLKMFSFMHNENVSFEMLVKAAHNPPNVEASTRQRLEEEERKNLIDKGMKFPTTSKSWRQSLRNKILQVAVWYGQRTSSLVLPSVLRDGDGFTFSVHDLRAAISRLTQKSLVTVRRKDDDEFYSMHPLVQKWVRERPKMSIGERALWCQAAGTMLSQCIPLPPLGSTESEIRFRRQLLPHVDAVRRFQEQTERTMERSRNKRMFKSIFLPHVAPMTPARAQQCARFSRLYSECSRFQDAENLQVKVRDYAIGMLGADDERTVSITLALSGTYWMLTRMRDAVDLQMQALETCQKTLGPEHPKTLKIMDALGKSEIIRGRYKESKKLLEVALEGMRKVLPADHQDIFLALDNLGTAWHRYFAYDNAIECHTQAVAGLTNALGPEHHDTITAKENLATALSEKAIDFTEKMGHIKFTEQNTQDLEAAFKLQREVLEVRQRNLGREDNWTLWSVCILGRIKTALGFCEEAEREMRVALAAGIRNLGERHNGILTGTGHLARVLVAQKRYDEAEQIFQDITAKSLYEKVSRAEGESPDQLLNVWFYAGCCQLNGRPQKAIELLEGVTSGLTSIGATRHLFWQRVLAKLDELRREVDAIQKAKEEPLILESG